MALSEEFREIMQAELEKPNYIIETENKDNYTVIYFSSQGLFGCSNVEMFKAKPNSFEFYKTRIEKASKHIFVRDLNYTWYKDGINKDINSDEKLLEFLKEETIGSKIITIGSSAGGYAAVFFGIRLNAEYIFSFSGQFNSPEKYADFDILNLLKNCETPIFYMYPTESEMDMAQFETVKSFKNVQILGIKSDKHGVPIEKNILKHIINSDIKKLYKMYNNPEISERIFTIKYFGIASFLSRMINKNLNCIAKKFN